MKVQPNPAKRALRRGEIAVGTLIQGISTPAVATMLARAGFQFLYIDTAHTPFTKGDVTGLVVAARAAGTASVVRPRDIDETVIGQILDIGATGVLIPSIETAEDVRRVVRACRFHPEGQRGMTMIGPHTDWYPLEPQDYPAINQEILVAVSIESDAGFANLEEIVSEPGLDVVVVGRWDLSQDLGIPGEVDHPAVIERLERMIAAATAHGVACGFFMPNVEIAKRWIAKGVRWVPLSSDVDLLIGGGARLVAGVRD